MESQLATFEKEILNRFDRVFNADKNKAKMLIVEDDLDMAALSKLLIEKYSKYECDSVCDAFEAFSAIYEKNYDYMLVDINLPGINGVRMMEQIDEYLDKDPLFGEKTHYCQKIPVLFFSGQRLGQALPSGLKHFEIIGFINKDKLSKKLAENFAS